MRGNIKDMTVGNPTQLMVSFMIPMIVGNIFQQFYNMVDSMIVGQFVGADALAAVGATGSLNWLFFSLCSGLASGIGIIISHFFGSGNHSYVKKTIANAVYIMLISGIVMGGLGMLLARPVLALLATPADIIDLSTRYMQIICSGIIFVAMYNCACSILRGLGDSKSPLYFLVIASIMNVALDLLFVVVLKMGVSGAAYATIIAQLFSAVSSILYAYLHNELFHLKGSDWNFDTQIVERCIRLGVPLAAQSSLIAISLVILQRIVNSFGTTVIAAFTATSRVESLIQQPYQSLSVAISTFTGQNLGAGNKDRAKEGIRQGLIISLIIALIMTPLMQLLGNPIIGLFVSEVAVIEMGATALRITSLFFLPLGLIYVYRGFLNGAGDASFSLINGFAEMGARIFFPKPLTMIPVVGVWGIWLGTGFTWLTVGLICFARYKSGAWKHHLMK